MPEKKDKDDVPEAPAHLSAEAAYGWGCGWTAGFEAGHSIGEDEGYWAGYWEDRDGIS